MNLGKIGIFAAIGALGFVIAACTPISKSNMSKIEVATSTAECSIPGVEVKQIGNGPDVVLIPGLGSPPAVYDDIVAKYQNNYRFHMVHVAGYAGLKSAQTTGSVFECAASRIKYYMIGKNLKGATIIGHSMGGELAMALNARNEGLVSKIMVVDALPFFSLLFGPNSTPDMVRPRAEAFTKMTLGQTEDEFKAAQIIAIARLVKSEVKRAEILGWSLASSHYAVAKGAEDLMLTDLRPELSNNKAKISMIYGYDAMMGLPQAYVDGLYQNAYKDIPNTSLKRIDNSLHFIMYDQPEAFAAEVGAFLAQ